MKRYFDITGSEYGTAVANFFEYDKKMDVIAEKFRTIINVKAKNYGHLDHRFYIEPTPNDLAMYECSLCKPCSNGLRAFKKNSMVGRAFIKLLKESKLTYEHFQPPVAMYIDDLLAHGEKHSSRIIYRNGRYYLSVTGTTNTVIKQEYGLTEITASEFTVLDETTD